MCSDFPRLHATGISFRNASSCPVQGACLALWGWNKSAPSPLFFIPDVSATYPPWPHKHRCCVALLRLTIIKTEPWWMKHEGCGRCLKLQLRGMQDQPTD